MKRNYERGAPIDLGAASIKTKGPTSGRDDVQAGKILTAGLHRE